MFDSVSKSRTRTRRRSAATASSGTSAAHEAPSLDSRPGAFHSAGKALPLAAPVQAKVAVGRTGDPYEREADQVAERVTRGEPAPEISRIPAGGLSPQRKEKEEEPEPPAQRQAEEEEEEEQVQTQEEPEEEEVQTWSVQLQPMEEEEQVQQQPAEEEEEEAVQAQSETEEEEVQEQPEEKEEEVQETALQRQEEPEEQEEPVQTWTVQLQPTEEKEQEVQEQAAKEEEEEPVQSKAAPGGTKPRRDKEKIASQAIHSRGAGQPLPADVRGQLERSMGVDLSDVRVHTDARAQRAARGMRARAFTHKKDIWLGPGESPSDKKLIAHEAAHVVQQEGVVRRSPLGGDRGPLRPPAVPAPVPQAGTSPASGSAQTGSRRVRAARPPDAETAPEAEGETVVGGEPAGARAAVPPPGEPAPAEPGPPSPPGSEAEQARFQGFLARLESAARNQKRHERPPKKVADARAAAEPPDNERSSRAQAGQIETMSRQEAKKPDRSAFLALLREKLRAIAPSNMEETENFRKQGKAGRLRDTLTAEVARQMDDSSRAIRSATETEPDPASVEEKPATPMPEEPADPPLPDLRARAALPLPKPEREISLERNKQQAEQLMADNDLDEEQLRKANEPQFTEALEAKHELDEHADSVPEAYRDQERSVVEDAEAAVAEDEAAAKLPMRAERSGAKSGVRSAQQTAKQREEQERRRVAAEIQRIYQETRSEVERKLSSLDEEVELLFDQGERAARDRFESYVERRMAEYKWDRYISRLGGSLLWAKDKLFGMPDEVNRFYGQGRDQYIADMDAVLERIAAAVENRLLEAKQIIARGKEGISEYVASLPKNLQAAGRESEKQVAGRFEDLERSVEDKKHQLAEQVARRYQEARQKLDERIEELKARNQGLLDAFIGKIRQIIEILRNFKTRVMALLKAGAEVVRRIVKDPVGFLGNLLAAVKKGFRQFLDNILVHLKKGLLGWLFGALAEAGIEVPADFSPKSLFGLVLQMLGLTGEFLRRKLVRFIGAKNAARLEKAWSIVSSLISAGPARLWERAKAFVGNLKQMILGQVREWLIAQIIQQGIVWLVSLFNPASALLKAIKLIYDVVMFFVENISRIAQLVKAVFDSTAQIAAGNITAAANWIETTMGRTVPVIIAFLARLLGLGGLAAKIKSVVQAIRRPVETAIDKVLKKIAAGVARLLGKGRSAVRKVAHKVKDFIYPTLSFSAGTAGHTIFFRGKGAAATPMVSSRPRTLTALLAELATRPENANKQDRVRSARAHLAALTRFQNDLKKAKTDEDQARIGARIREKIREISVVLAELMSAERFGTRAKPLPLAWPKPGSAQYPELYFGPKSDRRIPQSSLKRAQAGDAAGVAAVEKKLEPEEREKWEQSGHEVRTYTPHGSANLPGGEGPIGISSQWRVDTGKHLELPKHPRSTPGGGKLNNLLRKYGYRGGEEKLDADHVVEIQVGGEDELGNLWPLDSATNRASGKILSRKRFDINGKKVPMSVLKTRAAAGQQVHMEITSTR